ncbi:MAG: MATE family efflux transporter [Mogibacterium sp.]|nr:MATE family efflux transporter [Mogibacterium sp.]
MDFDKKEVNRKLARIATPIAIQGVVTATLSMVDNLMVGFLGETELAAVGVGGQLFMIHYLVLFGILSGCATFMAQFYGAKDMANIRKVVGFGFSILIAFGGLVFFLANLFTEEILSLYTKDPAVLELAAQYVRINSFSFLLLAFCAPMEMAFKATQQVRIPMAISAVVFSSNTLINYILIFGKFGMPALGVAGAAIGTLSARVLEVILNAILVTRKANVFRGSVRSYFGWDRELVRRIIKNAMPTTINEFLWSFGQTMFVAAYNRIGTMAYAAYQAANAVFNIFMFATFSIGDAALILVGEKLGEGDKEYTWKMSNQIIKVLMFVGITIGLITVALDKSFASLFNLSDEGKVYTFYVLLVFSITMPFDIFNGTLIAGILRGGGDTRFAMISEGLCIWLIAVPLAFISVLVWNLPIHLAVLMTRLETLIRGAILLKRYLSKKWMNTVIENL